MTTFDPNALLARLRGDQQQVFDLLEIFLSYETFMLTSIQEAVASNDAEAVGFAAHRAKGALLSIHAGAAATLSDQLESLVTAGSYKEESGRALLEKVEAEWATLIGTVSDYQASRPEAAAQ